MDFKKNVLFIILLLCCCKDCCLKECQGCGKKKICKLHNDCNGIYCDECYVNNKDYLFLVNDMDSDNVFKIEENEEVNNFSESDFKDSVYIKIFKNDIKLILYYVRGENKSFFVDKNNGKMQIIKLKDFFNFFKSSSDKKKENKGSSGEKDGYRLDYCFLAKTGYNYSGYLENESFEDLFPNSMNEKKKFYNQQSYVLCLILF